MEAQQTPAQSKIRTQYIQNIDVAELLVPFPRDAVRGATVRSIWYSRMRGKRDSTLVSSASLRGAGRGGGKHMGHVGRGTGRRRIMGRRATRGGGAPPFPPRAHAADQRLPPDTAPAPPNKTLRNTHNTRPSASARAWASSRSSSRAASRRPRARR